MISNNKPASDDNSPTGSSNWLDWLRLAQPAKASRVAGAAWTAIADRAAASYSAVADLKFNDTLRGTLLDKSI